MIGSDRLRSDVVSLYAALNDEAGVGGSGELDIPDRERSAVSIKEREEPNGVKSYSHCRVR